VDRPPRSVIAYNLFLLDFFFKKKKKKDEDETKTKSPNNKYGPPLPNVVHLGLGPVDFQASWAGTTTDNIPLDAIGGYPQVVPGTYVRLFYPCASLLASFPLNYMCHGLHASSSSLHLHVRLHVVPGDSSFM
jgi:hypothetical protein